MDVIAPKALMHRAELGRLCMNLQLLLLVLTEITYKLSPQGGRGRRQMRKWDEKRPVLRLELSNHPKNVEKRSCSIVRRLQASKSLH